MHIGLFFGSFNPVHHGHLIIGKHVVQEKLVDELWFVVSPHNPFKNEKGLLNARHRFRLIQLALEGEHHMRASDVEFNLPKPSYTANTLVYLKEKYPQHRFSIVLGSDGFSNILKWKNAEYIIQHHEFVVYERPGFVPENITGAKVHQTQGPQLYISSTYIRKLILGGHSARYLVPDIVQEEISNNNFYRNSLENPS